VDNLIIEATQYTPRVQMDAAGTIVLAGKSYPENTFEFYKPVMTWLQTYLGSDCLASTLVVNFEIAYFNSSTSSLFYDFFELLSHHQEQTQLIVNWYYQNGDESILEAGEDFIEDFPDMTINLCAK
jgi:hypothetical protein